MTSAIIDPTTSQHRNTASGTDAARPASLSGLRVGLLENGKRNAAAVLDAVGRVLSQKYQVGEVVRLKKENFAMPMDDELVTQLETATDAVVVGVGDCGSCSAAAVADGIRLEQTQLPSAVICTDAFETTGQAMAQLQGDEKYPFLLTPHPIANLTEEQIAQRAEELADEVAARLLSGRADSEAK